MPLSPLTLIFQAIDKASPTIKNIQSGLEENLGTVGKLAFAYNQVTELFGALAIKGREAYDLLIGQNVELQQQLLATQATLVATNKIIVDGLEIKDPTQAIQALTGPVKDAIADLRKGSFDLVGVTSNDLIPLFQSVTAFSAQIGANLKQSTQLALGFGAAAQTLNIPLQQTNTELRLILGGQISSENRLATSLNLNNEMVNRWRAQNVLVDEINKKLDAYRAGNALGAETVGGVTANIKELFLEFGRVAGEPLLKPLVDQLNIIYNFLKENRQNISDFVVGVSDFVLEAGGKIQNIIQIIQPSLQQIGQIILNEINANLVATENVIRVILDVVTALVTVSAPILNLVTSVVLELSKIANSPFGEIIIQATTLITVLGLLRPLIAGVGIEVVSLASRFVLLGGATGIAAQITAFASSITYATAAVGGLSGAMQILTTQGFGGLVATLTTAIPELGAFGVAATAAIAPLLPIIALGGAIALTLEIKQIGDLKQANDDLEAFREQIQDEGVTVNQLATNLRGLDDARKTNGALTAEQEKQSKQYQTAANNEVQKLQEKIAAIKQLNNLNPDQEEERKSQIADLQQLIDLLGKYSDGVKFQVKDLPSLGNEYQQLADKVSQALNQFNQPASDAQFKQAAQAIVKYTEDQLKAGQISQQQAEEQLAKVRDDTRVEIEVRNSADQVIVKSRQDAITRQNELAKANQDRIQALINEEVLGQYTGQQKILEAKETQLKAEIEATRQAIASEEQLRKAQADAEIARINGEIAASQARINSTPGDSPDAIDSRRVQELNIRKLAAQRNAVQASLNIQTDAGAKLTAQLQSQEAELTSTQEQARKARREQELTAIDERQKILDASYAQGLTKEQEYNRQTLALADQRAQLQLAQIAKERATTAKTDQPRLLELASQEADVLKKRAEANAKFEDAQVKLIERTQQQSLDIVKQSESDRLLQVSQLEQQGLISKQETEADSLKITSDRIKAEIALEKNKLAQLLALPPYTDPQKEQQRQDQINASRLNASQLAKSLVDNEIAQREALNKIIEDGLQRQLQAFQNNATAESQSLDNIKSATDALTGSLDNQIKLLGQRQQLVESLLSTRETELSILSQLTQDGTEKKQLAEAEAVLRLNAAEREYQISQQTLAIKEREKQLALEVEQIQLRQQQIQAQANTVEAQVNLKTVELKRQENPKDVSPEEVEAAQLKVQAAQAKQIELQADELLLQQKRQLEQNEEYLERNQLSRETGQDKIDQARLDVANARVDPNQGQREREQLQQDILRREANGGDPNQLYQKILTDVRQVYAPEGYGLPVENLDPDTAAKLADLEESLKLFSGRAAVTSTPIQITIPQAGGAGQNQGGTTQKPSITNTVPEVNFTQNITINGDANSLPQGRIEQEIIQPVREELKSILIKVMNQG